MSDYLVEVEGQLATGAVSAQALVLVFRAAEEAEDRHDVRELERAVELTRRIARAADGPLEAESERLIALCEERLEPERRGRLPGHQLWPRGARIAGGRSR